MGPVIKEKIEIFREPSLFFFLNLLCDQQSCFESESNLLLILSGRIIHSDHVAFVSSPPHCYYLSDHVIHFVTISLS